MCLSQETIASQQNYSETIPYCVLAEIPLHLIKTILRQFHIVF